MTEQGQNPATQPPQAPYPLAIIICDNFHIDPATGKKTILGTFTAFKSAVFPFKITQVVIYLALTDGRGAAPFELRLVKVDNDGDDEPVLFKAEGTLQFDDPLAVSELAIGLVNVELPGPGEYRFQFYACGEFVIERRLVVIDAAEESK